jgi:phosphoribosylformylglycinamidine synthase subunit PurS
MWRRARAGPFHAKIEVPMKVRVFVSLKSTVLDPQGQTVCSALHGLGYPAIAAVRQGKFFDISLAAGTTREQAEKDIDAIARDVLANPVIEDFRIEFLD